MKKTVSLILVLITVLSLCACGGKSDTVATTTVPTQANAPTEPKATEPIPTEPPVEKLSLGDTASTDVAEFTLLNADFTIFAGATTNNSYLMPTEGSTVYGASVGKILMVPSFTIKNKDRAGSMSVCGADWPFKWVVRYQDSEYPVYGFDLNYSDVSVEMNPGCVIDSLTEYYVTKIDTSNYLLYAGSEISMRIVTVVNFEPADLGDSFELEISLPTASGEFEKFIYVIPDADAPLDDKQKAALYDKATQLMELEKYYPALSNLEQLGDYQDSAELYDYCMRRYAVRAGMYDIAEEYLKEKMDSFRQLTGDELLEKIPGNSWYLQGVGTNGWKYLEDGTIDDGWGNDRSWSVEGDLLVLKIKKNASKVKVLEVYEEGYVLLENDEYYATLYKVEE